MISTKKLLYKVVEKFNGKMLMPNTINVNANVDNVSVASGTEKYVSLYTASTSGIFIGSITIGFPSNSNGIRSVAAARGSSVITEQYMNIPAVNGGQTYITIPAIVSLSSGQTLTARVWQNSGSSLTLGVARARGFLMTN